MITPLSPSGRFYRAPYPAAIASAFALVVSLQAQPAAKPADSTHDQVITLPEFSISESPANPYQSSQALSTSRVAMSIQDIPQTVSVVTSEMLQATMGNRMIEVAKYITPMTESSLAINDRYNIRGFQVSAEFIDGTIISGQDGYSSALMPFNTERIEIIKGPNGILVPGGSPGGVMNPITKSPLAKDRSEVTLEIAEYLGSSISADVNRVLDKDGKMAMRTVLAYWRSDGYLKNQYRRGYMFAPSFSYQLAPAHKLIVKAEIMQNRELNLGGVPIDPSVGSNDYARIADGLPRNWTFGDESDTRHRSTQRLSAELLSTLGNHVTSRLYVMGDHVRRTEIGGTNASIAGLVNGSGGSRNPLTGLFVPGVNYTVDNSGATAVVTSTAVPLPSPGTYTFTRNYGRVYLNYDEAHLKNDYAIRFEERWFKSTTILGYAGNTSKVHFKSWPSASRPSVSISNLNAITYDPYTYAEPTAANNGTNKTAKQNDLQIFVYENATFWDDRIGLSGGVSRFFGSLKRVDNTGIGVNPAFPNRYDLSATAKSFGLVIKPIKPVSLFYGYNTSGGQMPGSINIGNIASNLRVAEGNQKEFGVKTSLFEGRLTASFAHFNIVQSNYPAPNSEYYILVSQGVTPPADFPSTLYLDLTSKGWEFETSYSFSKNLTVFANYTRYELRQPFGVRYRAVPDHNGGAYIDYQFTQGPLDGFGVNVGIDMRGDMVGDQVNPGYTTTKPLPGSVQFVAQQPSFKIAPRNLYNVGVTYKRGNWLGRFTVVNATNKDYLAAALNRNGLVEGDPRSYRASVTYSFK